MAETLKDIKEGYRNRITCLVKEATLKTGTNGDYRNYSLKTPAKPCLPVG